MNFFRKTLKKNEKGSSEVIVTVLLLPVMFFFLMALIDVGLYFQTRTTIQNQTRDAARQVAIWGGNESRLDPIYINSNKKDSISDRALVSLSESSVRLQNLNKTKKVNFSCTPNSTSQVSQTVSCTLSGGKYKALTPGNPFTLWLNNELVITETAISEVVSVK